MFRAILLLTTAGLTLPSSPCFAQGESLPPVRLGAILRLHFGDTLWVAGRVMGQTGESISLQRPGSRSPTIEYQLSSLDSIQAKSGSHTLGGTGIGLAVGYVLGRILIAQACSGRGNGSTTCRAHPETRAIGNAVTGLVGAIGFVAGRAPPKWTRVR